MKIAINTLGPSRVKAGIGNYVVNLVNELQKLDKENEYLVFIGKENERLFWGSENFKFQKIQFFNKNKILRILWEQFILPFILKKKKIDILHSPGFVSPIFKTTKQIVTIHDMTFFTHPHFHLRFKVKYFQNMIPISVKRADMVITDSENSKRDIINILKISSKKLKTVHLGTNFKRQGKAKKWLKQKYQIDAPFILYVGVLEPRKNISSLIKAFAKLAPKIKHKLVIIGKKGWMFEEIFRLVEELNLQEKLIFTDFIPDRDLQYFYSAADLFVYPSYYEGFGIPVIEAMACGCPVITSNNSSLKEISNKNTLLLENPTDIEELAKKMKKILTNTLLQKQLKKSGLKRAKEFTWKKTAENTLEIYNSI